MGRPSQQDQQTPAKGQQGALVLTQLPLTAFWYSSCTTAASDCSVLHWQESLQLRSMVRNPLPNMTVTRNLAEIERS